MRAVWKYELPVNVLSASFTSVTYLPVDARLVHVREQGNNIAMWFEVDPEAFTEPRSFQLFATGSDADIREGLEYVGTAILEDVGVIHVYEVKAPPTEQGESP